VATVIYLDTHVVAWLYAGELGLFPTGVRSLLETEDLMISPVVELELQCLFELKRTSEPGGMVVDVLEREIGLKRCGLPFRQVIAAALENGWTRDPFDRIIVAQAQLRRTPLLTKDASIRDHYSDAVWLS
jgi:PIN domain nuclease of toxin-antitoxin system